MQHYSPSPLTLIRRHPGADDGIVLWVKRDDLVHPVVQGNKWRKLHRVIARMQEQRIPGMITFGGPFSNYLHAVALAGQYFGFGTAAIVRGTAADPSNPTLSDVLQAGMDVYPVTKAIYQQKENAPEIRAILDRYPDYLVAPEGGATADGVLGAAEISTEIWSAGLPVERLIVATPAGTGSTAAGILAGLQGRGHVMVFPAAYYGVTRASIQALLREAGFDGYDNFTLQNDYIMGKFARPAPEVIDFARRFEQQNGFPLDPIYTSRMMFGVFDLLARKAFPPGSVIVAVHTGGLQGWRGRSD